MRHPLRGRHLAVLVVGVHRRARPGRQRRHRQGHGPARRQPYRPGVPHPGRRAPGRRLPGPGRPGSRRGRRAPGGDVAGRAGAPRRARPRPSRPRPGCAADHAARASGSPSTTPRSGRPGACPGGSGPDDLVVHQQDVQAVVNALWRGGADGVQIMDQRLIATSAVRCVGNTLILQGRVYSPPYTITAVGDPDAAQPGARRLRARRRALPLLRRLATASATDRAPAGQRARLPALLTARPTCSTPTGAG